MSKVKVRNRLTIYTSLDGFKSKYNIVKSYTDLGEEFVEWINNNTEKLLNNRNSAELIAEKEKKENKHLQNMKNQKRFPLFSNGTEFMLWTERNCARCIKAVFYNEKKDIYPKYRCRIQEHIEMACIGDGMGSERDYKATHSYICPYIKTERPRKKPRKNNDNELTLF